MKLTVKNAIYRALVENHWLNFKYKNKNKEVTLFYFGIEEIDIKNGKIKGRVFNPSKSLECLENQVSLTMEGVLDAVVLEETYYPPNNSLITKLLDTSSDIYKFLEVDTLDNNILKYLTDCYKHDNDPYIKERALIDGVIPQEFLESKTYQLSEEQFKAILGTVFKKYKYEDLRAVQETQQMGMNVFSINFVDKQFVVAYRPLTVNFKNKTLKISNDICFNTSFLIDEEQVSLSHYLDMSPNDFTENFAANHREYIELIKENLNLERGERINTDTSIFLLARRNSNDLERACNSIKEMEENDSLTMPLKAFFGRSRPHTGTSKDPAIVIADKKKINIDQMRVVYSSMVNHVTYVKGPPGTGKTETIFNVILSALANNKTVLICSNNNHPLNDIYEKLTTSFYWKNPKTGVEKKLNFPALRIFNNNETPKTLAVLREILKYAESIKNINVNDSTTSGQKEKSIEKNSKLREVLKEYEEKLERLEDIERLKKIGELGTTYQVRASILEQIAIKNGKVAEARNITDEEVANYATSAKEDENFMNYLNYSFMSSFKRLLNITYKPLRDIIIRSESPENIQSCIKEFNEYLRDDTSLKRLLNIFPIIVCTNNSSDKLGSPTPHFDLVIMDEAGQCNMASSLIPITRGADLLLVGDTNQLQPVTVIDDKLNQKFRDEYGVKKEYDYVDNSILSCMTSKDKNSKSLLLRYHYRCGKKIASFPNARYYNDQLKLLNENSGSLLYVDVHNSANPNERNSYLNEALEIVNIVKNGGYKDVGIITPFNNQAKLINSLLEKEGITNVKAGTVHTLQGSEKPTIILSSALSLKTAKRTLAWIENNSELINVAVTRARERLIFVGDKEAIDLLSKNRNTDLKALSDYVAKNGEVLPPKSEKTIITDFSNNSASEQLFFDTVKPYFNRRGTKFKIERNLLVRNVIKGISAEEEMSFGHKEFDVVIFATTGLMNRKYIPIVVFEIDGGEHIGSKSKMDSDRTKEEICKRHGIKVIRIANSDVKDYEMIIQLFEKTVSGSKEISEFVQGSLFDDDLNGILQESSK